MIGHNNEIRKKVAIISAFIVIISILSAYGIFQFSANHHQLMSSISPKIAGGVYFFNSTSDPGTYAIGMVIHNNHSLIFLWNKINNTTVVEVDYICPPQFQGAYNIIIQKGRSPYTDDKIIPCNITKISENVYEFKYYDGWHLYWSFGYAKLYLANKTIIYGSHVKI